MVTKTVNIYNSFSLFFLCEIKRELLLYKLLYATRTYRGWLHFCLQSDFLGIDVVAGGHRDALDLLLKRCESCSE